MITVITPTYNRAHTLGKCYESLINQTCKDFIWMIIDDGSNDNTLEIVDKWKQDNVIRIQYYKKPNGGKASALNYGIDRLDTPYAVCLDSDDYFCVDAIEKATKRLETIKEDDAFCGLLALRSHEDGSVLGNVEIPNDMHRVKAEDLLITLNLRTEYICFYKTSILKEFRFPEIENEKFIPPSWMMFAITRDHYYLVSHERYCICEYLGDGITRNKKNVIVKNPKGYSCAKKWYFELSTKPILIIKNGIMYDCGCIIAKDKNWLKNTRRKIWAIALYPAGYIVYLKRFKRLTREYILGKS